MEFRIADTLTPSLSRLRERVPRREPRWVRVVAAGEGSTRETHMAKAGKRSIDVETLTHRESKRRNIPTAELQSVMQEEDKSPIAVAYEVLIEWDTNLPPLATLLAEAEKAERRLPSPASLALGTLSRLRERGGTAAKRWGVRVAAMGK